MKTSGAKRLLRQIKQFAIKVKTPATKAVANLRVPRPLSRRPKPFKF